MWKAAFIMLISGATYWVSVVQDRGRRVRSWQEVVESCGLRVVEKSAGWSPRLRALDGLVSVRIESGTQQGRSILIAVEAPAPPDFHRVTIRPESKLKLGREIEIGDRAFDDTFFIQGPARLVFALLDAETRRLIIEVKEKSWFTITASELRSVVLGDDKIAGVLPLLLDLRKRFLGQIAVLHRLVDNATEDPEPGVRLQNLLLLIRELSSNPETDRAFRKACLDPVPRIRLLAARQLGADGRGVLLKLAEGEEEDDISAKAFAILERELPFERVSAILGLALRRRRLLTARACLEALGRRRAASGVDLLTKVLEREHGELALAAAQALGATGSPAAEPPLLQALEREDADVRVAAANALGRIGSAAAVPPLKEAAERSGIDRELRRAARQAIAEIQSRVHGAPGQLSLAGAEAGQLSLAEGEAGQLSLAEDPAGQLSLPPGERPA